VAGTWGGCMISGMIRSMPAAALLAVIGTAVATAEPLTGKVVRIADGDTITVLDAANVQHKVRLQGIDAPERGQPFGTVARDRLAGLAMGKAVAVIGGKRDKYGRTLARVEIGGDDVGLRLVAEGLAWHYTRYSDDAGLAAAERAARAARRGLWADAAPVPPWEWRAARKARKAAQRQPAGR
jgi:endonuclease YncB( thermonuclease family)